MEWFLWVRVLRSRSGYAGRIAGLRKKEKGRVLDSFCESTGLSRATARRYLTSDVTGNPGVVRIDYRKARATKYSTVAKRILQRVWVLSGCQCGKYLAVSMRV